MIVNLFNKSEIDAILLHRICGFYGAGPMVICNYFSTNYILLNYDPHFVLCF
jgi:hypothetical protein